MPRADTHRLGPGGLPLKAYVVALLDSREWVIRGLSSLARLATIKPPDPARSGSSPGSPSSGSLARAAGMSVSSAVPIYVTGWTVFYLVFWWVRRG